MQEGPSPPSAAVSPQATTSLSTGSWTKRPCLPMNSTRSRLQPGGYHVLTLRQLALKDSGTVHFEAGDQRTSAALQVSR